MRVVEFEGELRPCLDAQLGCPLGQRGVTKGIEYPAASKGQGGQHGDATLKRQRQDQLFCRTIVDGVVDLDEVELVAAHETGQFLVIILGGGGDAEVADAAFLFPFAQHRQHVGSTCQVVDLQQIEAVRLQSLQ